jgi:poly(glycerol-phosphate) alpha-glucosyltransferase
MLTNLRAQTGGLHQAIYMRLQALYERFPNTLLLTMDYDQHFNANLASGIRRNNVPSEVEVVNSYRWFMDREGLNQEHVNRTELASGQSEDVSEREADLITIKYLDDDNKKLEGYRCFENGVYKRYEGFVDGRLDFIDYFSKSWVREEKHLYAESGALECIIHLDPVLNKPRFARYFNIRGECFLSARVDPKTGVEGPIFLHGYRKQFRDRWQLIWFWIDLVARGRDNPVIFIDKRELIDLASASTYKKIYVLHSSHLLNSASGKRELVPSLRPMLKNEERIDRIVVCTPNQRKNLIDDFGLKDEKIVAIPHCQKRIPLVKPMSERVGKRVVTIARYHPVKALHEAIHAFSKVLASVPGATYDIYGYGPLRDDLQKLIDSLGMASQVKLRGFSADYTECFLSAKVSVLTSLNEGFGVVIAESMACGTPVVSYETDFGPKYLVRDGVDGYLVPMGNRDILAERIVDLLADDEKSTAFSSAALEVTDRLSEDDYRVRWSSLVTDVYQ